MTPCTSPASAAAAAHAGDVPGVIALEAAYAALAHSLNRKL